MQIVYCETCGHRISEAEITQGGAVKLGENRFACVKCAPKPADAAVLPQSGKLPTQKAPTVGLAPATAPATVSARSHRLPTASERAQRGAERRSPEASEKKPAVLIAAGAGALLLVGVLAFALTGGSNTPASKSDPKTTSAGKSSTPPTPVASPAETKTLTKTVSADPREDPKPPPPPETPAQAPDIRSEVATARLAEAKEYARTKPDDPWTYEDKLKELASTYRSTPAGAEATKLLADLKVPPRPAPPAPPEMTGSGAWTPIFDGKSLDRINLGGAGGWKLENGALEHVPTERNSAQVRGTIDDGEFKIRFECKGESYGTFVFRQGPGQGYTVLLGRNLQSAVEGHVNELVVLCNGEQVTATLNGKALTVENKGTPKSGHIQFNTKAAEFRVLSIETRKLAPK
ncbi:MAG: hypothetical protein HY291_17410 [Planctomycetes bacterium]|nr:hypothetical protein [Planctomycetota bacterium]